MWVDTQTSYIISLDIVHYNMHSSKLISITQWGGGLIGTNIYPARMRKG